MKKFILTSLVCISVINGVFAQLTGALALTTSVTPANACTAPCDGTASVKASGGTAPYTYNWSTSPTQTTSTATGLCPGTYTVLVNDATPSLPNYSTATVTIICNGTSSSLVLTPSSTAANACTAPCDGTASVAVSGGIAPYTYGWSTVPAQTTQQATGLCPGTYSVIVRDATTPTPLQSIAVVTVTCAGITPSQLAVTTSVTVATACTAPCNGTATAMASGGTPPYFYTWGTSPVQTTQTATGLCPGTYTVNVYDSAVPNPNQSKTSATVLCTTPNGITSLSMTQDINVFPNPAHSQLNIEFTAELQGKMNISIKTILGTEIFREVVEVKGIYSRMIDISSLPEGIYMMEFVTDHAVAVKQFVKN